VTGEITHALEAEDFARGVEAVLAMPATTRAAAARAAVEQRDWSEAGRRFWQGSPA
jgi:hypothetical protein